MTLYSPEQSADLDFGDVTTYLNELFPSVSFRVAKNPLRLAGKRIVRTIAEQLAAARVKDPCKETCPIEPMLAEVDYESRTLSNDARIGGIVYDGRQLEETLVRLLGDDLSAGSAAIVTTDRLVSTYSRDDLRHHLRTVVFGFPSVLSVPGIVEAPAKPREYYLLRQQLGIESNSDLRLEQIRSALKGRFLDYGDPMIIEVVKGLALQAVFYHLTLDPFCEDRDCRFFNAHWQEDLIRSQISKGTLCRRHEGQLNRLSKTPMTSW